MFKKYFIPSPDNGHQPHILRRRGVLVILVFVLLVEAVFLAQILLLFPYTNFFATILPNVLVELTNFDRQENSVSALKDNPLLAQAARLKAQDMVDKSYFSHTSPEGVTPWYWLDKIGYNFEAAGENLAVNFSDSKDIEQAWMNSPAHRANILNNDFKEIGIAAAKGSYKGREAVFVVQFFGRPAGPVAKKTALTKTAPPKTAPVVTTQPKTENKDQTPLPSATDSEKVPQEMFIVKQVTGEESVVSGAMVETTVGTEGKSFKIFTKASVWLRKIVSMPKTATDSLYLLTAFGVFLALLLKIFIKIKIQYPKLIFNGISILFVIISILYLNHLVAQAGNIF